MLNILKTPRLVEAAHSPIPLEVSYTGYQLTDRFFVEVLDNAGSLLATLQSAGNGTGFCAFDLSEVVSSLFPAPKTLSQTALMQPDETALVPYRLKAGILHIVGRSQVKTYHYSTDTLYGLRAALPKDGSEDVASLLVDYAREARFLTGITRNQSAGADLFLPILVTAPTTVTLVQDLSSQTLTNTFTLPALGVYVFNANPILQGVAATGLQVWLESDTPAYTATATATVNCTEAGYIGSQTATATASSNVSMQDAQLQAAGKAAEVASADLVCAVDPNATLFTSTQSFTAYCPDGQIGEYTASSTKTSYVSQADADSLALQDAQLQAEAALVCQTVFSATKTVEVTCSDSTTRSATATETSTVSQADADQKATDAATDAANAQCPALNLQLAGFVTSGFLTADAACSADLATEEVNGVYTESGTFSFGEPIFWDSLGASPLGDGYYKEEGGFVIEVYLEVINDNNYPCPTPPTQQ